MRNNVLSIRKVPASCDKIIKFAKYRNPISHPVTIFRKQAVMAVGGYPLFRKSQDYALWSLMLKNGYRFANIDEILLKMRCGNDFLKRRGLNYFKWEFDILKFQRKIKFITNYEFIRNVLIRFTIRMLPEFIKKILYQITR